MLSKQQILECKDIQSEVLPIPEWGNEVTVKGLSLREKDEWEDSIMQDGKVSIKGATARLCILAIVDESGKRIFSESDITALSAKSPIALNRIFEVAQRLSGIGKKEIEETVKNSEKTQTQDSD